MPDSTAVAEKSLPDFVDLDLARRLEMAETISPDCYEALRRYGPSDPVALLKVAGGYALLLRPRLSREPDRRNGIV